MGTIGAMLLAVLAVLIVPHASLAQGEESGCLRCHAGIEPIREETSPMLATIRAFGQGVGDPAGCVVCHGGNPQAKSKGRAHRGAPGGAQGRDFLS